MKPYGKRLGGPFCACCNSPPLRSVERKRARAVAKRDTAAELVDIYLRLYAEADFVLLEPEPCP